MDDVRIEIERRSAEEVAAVAWRDGEIVGELVMLNGVVEVTVGEGHRRRGIATALLQALADAGYEIEHNWGYLTADGWAWLAAVEPEKTALCRIWAKEQRLAYEQNEWLFPSFAEWCAQRPQLEPTVVAARGPQQGGPELDDRDAQSVSL